MKNLKKELFYFIDFNIELIKKYEKLGFEVNIDDEVNEIYYVYMNLNDYDLLNVFNICEECYKENLDLYINIEDEIFNLKDDFVFEPTEYFYLAATPASLYDPVTSLRISILDSGNILIQPDQITSGNATLSFLEKAILKANVGAISNKPGYWIDTTGQISDAMVLQGKSLDATEQSLVLYQPFSYVIRSSLSIDKWKESVKTVLHPAGFALFSEINNETDPNNINDASVSSPNDSEVFTYSTTTIDSTLGFFNASNITYTNALGTLPLVVDTIFLQTNPQ